MNCMLIFDVLLCDGRIEKCDLDFRIDYKASICLKRMADSQNGKLVVLFCMVASGLEKKRRKYEVEGAEEIRNCTHSVTRAISRSSNQ